MHLFSFLYSPNFWFSLISIVLSLYASISVFLEKHKQPIVDLNWCYFSKDKNNIETSFLIYNGSSVPASVTKVKCLNKNISTNALNYPIELMAKDRSKTLNNQKVVIASGILYSTGFPINITTKNAVEILILFESRVFVSNVPSQLAFEFTVGNKKIRKSFETADKVIQKDKEQYFLNSMLKIN